MAEVTTKTVQDLGPNLPSQTKRVFYVTGVSAANNDVLTVNGLTSVQGAYLVSTTGTAGALTFATNVITITNGSTLTWTGLAWGTP